MRCKKTDNDGVSRQLWKSHFTVKHPSENSLMTWKGVFINIANTRGRACVLLSIDRCKRHTIRKGDKERYKVLLSLFLFVPYTRHTKVAQSGAESNKGRWVFGGQASNFIYAGVASIMGGASEILLLNLAKSLKCSYDQYFDGAWWNTRRHRQTSLLVCCDATAHMKRIWHASQWLWFLLLVLVLMIAWYHDPDKFWFLALINQFPLMDWSCCYF